MQIPIVQIGNSKGIRLNKMLLDKYKFQNKVEIVLVDDGILLKPIMIPRQNWDESFAQMRQNGDDNLIIDSIFEDENWD